jgi:hypothetical protein
MTEVQAAGKAMRLMAFSTVVLGAALFIGLHITASDVSIWARLVVSCCGGYLMSAPFIAIHYMNIETEEKTAERAAASVRRAEQSIERRTDDTARHLSHFSFERF